MARTLEELNTAVQALEVQVNNTYRGVMSTLQNLAALIESRHADVTAALGETPSSTSPGSGILGELAAIRIILADLSARISALENP